MAATRGWSPPATDTPTGAGRRLVPSVPRFLYLASPGGGIFAANLNASNPRPLVGAQSDTPAVAVDASYLYWATQNDVANGGGTITRANLDGSGQRFLAIGSNNPTGVAVDASYVYWTTGGAGPSSGRGQPGRPGRQRPAGHRHRAGVPAEHGGGRRQPHLLGLARWVGRVRARSGRPAWTAAARRPSSEARTDQWGGAPMAATSTGPTLGETPNSGTISLGPASHGSDPQAIVPGQDFPYGVAVDASFLYWVNRGDDTVDLANLDGSDPQTLGSGQGAWGLAGKPRRTCRLTTVHTWPVTQRARWPADSTGRRQGADRRR